MSCNKRGVWKGRKNGVKTQTRGTSKRFLIHNIDLRLYGVEFLNEEHVDVVDVDVDVDSGVVISVCLLPHL